MAASMPRMDDFSDYPPPDQPPAAQPYQAYLDASREPLTGLWFALPLFLVYHAGIWWLQHFDHSDWLSAADVLIARGLSWLGAGAPFISFIFVMFCFLVAQQATGRPWRRPGLGTLSWMAAESLFFALPVFLLSRATRFVVRDLHPQWLAAVDAAPWMDGTAAMAGAAAAGEAPWTKFLADVSLSCGAGVYEEFLFRMLLLGGLVRLSRRWPGRRGGAAPLWPILLQALLFAAFHHLPGSPEPWVWEVFAFRVAAGVYFAYLYMERGFGVAAGAHAGYDLIAIALPWR